MTVTVTVCADDGGPGYYSDGDRSGGGDGASATASVVVNNNIDVGDMGSYGLDGYGPDGYGYGSDYIGVRMGTNPDWDFYNPQCHFPEWGYWWRAWCRCENKGTPVVGVVDRARNPSYWAAGRTGLPQPDKQHMDYVTELADK